MRMAAPTSRVRNHHVQTPRDERKKPLRPTTGHGPRSEGAGAKRLIAAHTHRLAAMPPPSERQCRKLKAETINSLPLRDRRTVVAIRFFVPL